MYGETKMGYLFHPQNSGLLQKSRILAIIKIIDGIFKWLARSIMLTKEDEENAGVYLGGEGRD
jgi:hypothetical protein